MARTLTLAAGALAIAAASTLYAFTFETQRIEREVHRLEREIEKAERDIAVLKTERAFLGRPGRIDTLAREQGLGPIGAGQYRRLGAPDAGDRAASLASDAEALAAARAILGQAARPDGGQP